MQALPMMRRVALGVLMAISGGAGAGAESPAQSHKGYEAPPYAVEASEGAFEIRAYGAHLVAEVTVSGSRDDSIGEGFRVLAGYIFGGNATGQKIAMTVPVAQSPQGDGRWTVRFMMPGTSQAETLPAPLDGAIRFVRVAPERQVVIGFTGLRGDAVLAAQAAELRQWAKAQGLTVTAGPHYCFYDGPMTLPWMRRNEVAFSVE